MQALLHEHLGVANDIEPSTELTKVHSQSLEAPGILYVPGYIKTCRANDSLQYPQQHPQPVGAQRCHPHH